MRLPRRLPTISSLYGRIFAIFWFTMLLVLLAVLLIPRLDPRQSHQISEQHLERIEKLSSGLEMRFSDAPDLNVLMAQLNNWDRRNDKVDFYITDLEGNLLNRKHFKLKRMMQNFISERDLTQPAKQKLYGRNMVAGPFPITLANTPLLMFSSVKWKESPPFLIQLLDQPFRLLLVVMVVSTPLLLWLAWALSIPARRLEEAAKRVAQGEFTVDPELEKGTKEFRQTGASFNQMVEAVNQMIGGQQRLLSDISHELRSPLTRLRMANALATRKQGESAELSRIDTEAERLEKMISELLTLSRMQTNSHQERESLSANELWLDLLEDAKFEAENKDKSLTFGSIPNVLIKGNPNLLMSAVENVVRNAIHYSESSIAVSLTTSEKRLSITVDDDGAGVPESELDQIFRPFYRVSTARDRHSGGAGLGLAITESAIRQHSGSLSASVSPMGGLRVTMTLPCNQE
ncbi:envelope stress sensor histidine kinase CpxA [Vibrio sp. SCSIO 43136]|uniref:envelope stress sensor histidine kinase CpxA n=1 Tax=Vibrio sp. SCSIO 43136 TaxID=2819101 RepID=UPI0020750165|nr:envelope stress sensor histidine kinase CpxA [Vibrio sp. SCSIO 43136]USD65460.1 envelope stress sensor histidine kinase CpxA [Vibrio sp. SCSIO 43136]